MWWKHAPVLSSSVRRNGEYNGHKCGPYDVELLHLTSIDAMYDNKPGYKRNIQYVRVLKSRHCADVQE